MKGTLSYQGSLTSSDVILLLHEHAYTYDCISSLLRGIADSTAAFTRLIHRKQISYQYCVKQTSLLRVVVLLLGLTRDLKCLHAQVPLGRWVKGFPNPGALHPFEVALLELTQGDGPKP